MTILMLHPAAGPLRQNWRNNGGGLVAHSVDGYVVRNRTTAARTVDIPGFWFNKQKNDRDSSRDLGMRRGIVAPLRFDVMAFNQGPGRVRTQAYLSKQDLGLKVAEYQ